MIFSATLCIARKAAQCQWYYNDLLMWNSYKGLCDCYRELARVDVSPNCFHHHLG